ncbi:MAG TPA: LysM peptidoglycan-binding domain-containing protein [Steroidobacteraceae bacterium]|nr:LysM peptidoglycan-binding domain-containing protein [Steroidobacteraceae bacterium]
MQLFSARRAALACAGLALILTLGSCSLLHGRPRTAAATPAEPPIAQADDTAAVQTSPTDTEAAIDSGSPDAAAAAASQAAPDAIGGAADGAADANRGATTTVLADAGPALKASAPENYVVKRGDTLWGIANMFLRNPWEWPEIWYVNPDIRNPHRIYPGDTLHLALASNGRTVLQLVRGPIGRAATARLTGFTRLEPLLRSSPLDAPIESIPYSVISAFISRPTVLTREQIESAAYVVALAEDHDIAGTGHELFVRKTSAQPGTRYSVMHIEEPLVDPDSGHRLGYVAIYTGTAQITRPGPVAEAVLTNSARETLQGDVLIPEERTPTTDFVPHVPAQPVSGSVIDVIDNVLEAGQDQVVAINRGSADGVERGTVLTIDQLPSQALDECAEIDNSSTCVVHHSVNLPTDPAGNLLVFRTFPHLSYALILADTVPVQLGDRVHGP